MSTEKMEQGKRTCTTLCDIAFDVQRVAVTAVPGFSSNWRAYTDHTDDLLVHRALADSMRQLAICLLSVPTNSAVIHARCCIRLPCLPCILHVLPTATVQTHAYFVCCTNPKTADHLYTTAYEAMSVCTRTCACLQLLPWEQPGGE